MKNSEMDNRDQIGQLFKIFAVYLFIIGWALLAFLYKMLGDLQTTPGIDNAKYIGYFGSIGISFVSIKLTKWTSKIMGYTYWFRLDFAFFPRLLGFIMFTYISAACMAIGMFIPLSIISALIYSIGSTFAFSKVVLYYYDKKQKELFSGNLAFAAKGSQETAVNENQPLKEENIGNVQTVLHTGDIGFVMNSTGYGSASWISDEKKNLMTEIDWEWDAGSPVSHGLGLWIGGGFFNNDEGNLCTIAPPGKGKGAALIIPNLLYERLHGKNSYVVFDPKGTNACITAKFQQQIGQKVIIIDPMNLQEMNGETHHIKPACFNPLDEITEDVYGGCALIASLLLPDDPRSNDPFWNNKARELLQGVLMHVMTDDEFEGERTLIKFYNLLKGGKLSELFINMIGNINVNYEISHIGNEFSNMMKTTDKTFISVLSAATNAISWLGNPSIQKVITRSDFKTSDFAAGGITLYLCQPIHHKEQFATFSRLIVGSIMRKNAQPSRTKKAWVYYLLDEFPSMGIFPEVVDTLALGREYKMRIWLFSQSLSQMDELYKSEGRNRILGNIGIFQSIGATDHVTQEYISKRIGNTTRFENSKSTASRESQSISKSYQSDPLQGRSGRNDNKAWDKTETVNYAPHSRLLLMPEEVEREPHIITLTKDGPMRLVKWQYWEKSTDPIGDKYTALITPHADPNPNFD